MYDIYVYFFYFNCLGIKAKVPVVSFLLKALTSWSIPLNLKIFQYIIAHLFKKAVVYCNITLIQKKQATMKWISREKFHLRGEDNIALLNIMLNVTFQLMPLE